MDNSQWPEYSLTLADGSCWILFGMDEVAAEIVTRFSEVMGMKAGGGEGRRIGVALTLTTTTKNFFNNEHCLLYPHFPLDPVALHKYFVKISLFITHQAQKKGAVLLHGALAKRGEQSVILAARSGTGKTTASMRLPAPWCSLSDDATLVVRDQAGIYWAHPWPTWSCFQNGGTGGPWDVQQMAPLKAIFFLQQAEEERIESIGAGQAAGKLTQAIEQAVGPLMFLQNPIQVHALRLELFENACMLARHVPAYFLHLSLNGLFWQKMEEVLG